MSTSFDNPREARERVLADYAMLRKLMLALVGATRCALRDETQRPVMRAALLKLRSEVERHLDSEEEVLVPLLHEADAWGTRRAEQMTRDHAAQRSSLETLVRDASDRERDVADLADAIARFVRRFERGMRDELQLFDEATFVERGGAAHPSG